MIYQNNQNEIVPSCFYMAMSDLTEFLYDHTDSADKTSYWRYIYTDGRQAIIWTNAGILLIGLLETNFSEILI